MIYLFTLPENYLEFSGHFFHETSTLSLINIFNKNGYIIIDYKKGYVEFGEIINENIDYSSNIPATINFIDGKPNKSNLDSEFLKILEKEIFKKILGSI